jgi:MoaA/NifB/PqqE/SkfB family radical SAM enzyme
METPESTLQNLLETPGFIVWDLTYACPLRCSHCYAEAGRRAPMQLERDDLYRVADALISLRPKAIMLSGGEPLLVRSVFEVADRFSKAGIAVLLYTGGWGFEPAMVPPILSLFTRVSVSIDGATAGVHDRIRGRAGSFERALSALAHLDRGARECRDRGEGTPSLGIEFVVMQSNFHQLHELCLTIAPQFPALNYISFGAVIPSGLATRAEFVEQEMLSEEQMRLLAEGEFARELQSLAPDSVEVTTTDNREMQMRPDLLAAGVGMPALHVEPNGMMRAMCSYEGNVGSLLTEAPLVLWERALERLCDPFVVEVLTPVRTTKEWAEATRLIDEHFGSPEVRARIARQPRYTRE